MEFGMRVWRLTLRKLVEHEAFLLCGCLIAYPSRRLVEFREPHGELKNRVLRTCKGITLVWKLEFYRKRASNLFLTF